jgi:importin subunit beta-1
LPYCDEIVALLLRNLQNSSLNRNVKPPILSCFGDIALAIGGHFEKYMQVTMNMLQQASMTKVDSDDAELLDYLHALREGVLEAYTGVLQGFRAENKADVFVPYVQGAMMLITTVAQEMQTERDVSDEQRRDDVLRAAVGVVGDLASTLGSRFKPLARQPEYKEHIRLLFREGNKSPNESTKQITQWAHSVTYLH